jgi:hypothetical protein
MAIMRQARAMKREDITIQGITTIPPDPCPEITVIIN